MGKIQVAVAVVAVLMFATRLAAADEVAPESKDRGTAFWLSGGGTAVSIGLVLAGASTHSATLSSAGAISSLVTPAAGEIYAGKLFTAGMGIRLVSLGIAYAGAAELASCSFPLAEAGSCSGSASAGSGAALLILGGLGYWGGIIYDIATAGRAVDDYNQRLRLHVTPTVIPTASSGPAVGLGLGGSF
jgi:hypothetical protein